MTSESVKVIVRCRPLNQREHDLKSKVVVKMDNRIGQVSITNPHDSSAPPKSFTFDGAYFMDSTTEQIYNEITYPLVEGVIEGYNGTVFAYGQTGCGKSFSMQGISEPSCQRGIIPRAFEHIFEAIATSEDAKYLVHASYLEIYNEDIRDLLGKECKKKLELKEHPERGAYIPGLSQHPVHDVKECERIMERGWRNRSVGATLMNADSSRSHSIFTVSLEMIRTDDEGEEHIRTMKLNLVDLAGSERQAKTGATGDRLKEATKINLSLSALGNVISALVDGRSKHIPYRDSKLTRLLQDSLGGNTKTMMVACLSPADNNYDESLSTLRYANRAKNIQNKPIINEDPKDALLREYQEEIKRLKEMLGGKVEQGIITPTVDNKDNQNHTHNIVEDEKNRLKMEYEQMMQDLRDKYDQEQRSHAKLQEDVNRLRQHYEEEMHKLNNTQSTVSVGGAAAAAAPLREIPSKEEGNSHVEENEEFGGEPMEDVVGEFPTLSRPLSPKPDVDLNGALKRLQELEEQMVGGEKVHDKELKEKRLKKKKAAEKRLRIIADALQQVDEDDKAMLKVYDNIQEELKVKTELLKKEKQRVRALEREIKDLQSEFEFDRVDYLETIRRQDQQIRLLQQILDKIQPCLRRDCNYSNFERVKGDSTWDEDQQRWRLPELVIVKTKLPPAGVQPGGRAPSQYGHSRNGTSNTGDNLEEDKFLQKLERGEQEDIAGNYFRPKRAKELLQKAQEDSARLSNIKNYINGNGINTNSSNLLYNAVIHTRDTPSSSLNSYIVTSSAGSPLNKSSMNGIGLISGGGSLSGPTSPESAVRKPTRLEALPIGDMTKKNKRKKNGFTTVDS